MQTQIDKVSNVNIVAIDGELDLYNCDRLKETVLRLWDAGERSIVFDLSNLHYLDSSGVGVLLYIFTSSQKRGLDVAFASLTPKVQKVITLTKLDGFLPITDTIEEAVDVVNGAPLSSEDELPEKKIYVDGTSPLFSKAGLYHKTFYIDLTHVRRLSNLIAQKAPGHLREINILEQQISEIIKNGVKHGNNNDKTKGLKVWFAFSDTEARLIVEDEGDGFYDIEKWNDFYRKKMECYERGDYEAMMDYLTFRTARSDDRDGGNAMCAAVEYWNGGVVFNEARNAVAVRRIF